MRGFGFSIDLKSGFLRKWYIDAHGIKRWHHDDSIASKGLPFNIDRCKGVGSPEEGWREGCDICLRRLSLGDGDNQKYIQPPEIIVFECEHLISA